jgi:hypothetical protein
MSSPLADNRFHPTESAIEPDLPDLPLFLRALRVELEKSQQSLAAEGKDPVFELQDVEVELGIMASWSRDVEGGLDFRVFGLGVAGGGKTGEQVETVNRIKLTLGATGELRGGVAFDD